MLIAIEFPEGKQGKRTDLATSQDPWEVDFSKELVRQARLIVRWAGDLADRVAAGAVKFDVALPVAEGSANWRMLICSDAAGRKIRRCAESWGGPKGRW